MMAASAIQKMIGGAQRVKGYSAHTGENVCVKADACSLFILTRKLSDVFFKVFIRKLIGRFVFAIGVTVLLDCVVRKVNKEIPGVFE